MSGGVLTAREVRTAVASIVLLLLAAALIACGYDSSWDTDRGGVDAPAVYVAAGTFTMGEMSARFASQYEPVHEVTISYGYCAKATEVSYREWSKVFAHDPSQWRPAECQECPVDGMSWYSALEYANRLSAVNGMEPCYQLNSCEGEPGSAGFTCDSDVAFDVSCPGYRMPTEAEWEYLARAGTDTEFPCGDGEFELRLFGVEKTCPASMDGLSNGGPTYPVGGYRPNDWGIHDTVGNVSEWAWDGPVLPGNEPVTDPVWTGPAEMRAVRGGSVQSGYGRSALRDFAQPAAPTTWSDESIAGRMAIGLRLVRRVDDASECETEEF